MISSVLIVSFNYCFIACVTVFQISTVGGLLCWDVWWTRHLCCEGRPWKRWQWLYYRGQFVSRTTPNLSLRLDGGTWKHNGCNFLSDRYTWYCLHSVYFETTVTCRHGLNVNVALDSVSFLADNTFHIMVRVIREGCSQTWMHMIIRSLKERLVCRPNTGIRMKTTAGISGWLTTFSNIDCLCGFPGKVWCWTCSL